MGLRIEVDARLDRHAVAALLAMAVCGGLALPAAAESAAAEDPAVETAPDVLPEADEEMVVTAPGPVRGEVPSLNYIRDIYYAHQQGAKLYLSGQYEEAHPYLLAAAQAGFKLSQVRLGALYRFGLGGVTRDDFTALGWLGTAARGETDTETKNLFEEAWAHVPEEVRPQVTAIIDEFEARYGGDANRVSCDMTRKAGSHISRLTCSFEDEYLYGDYDDLLEGLGPNTAPNP